MSDIHYFANLDEYYADFTKHFWKNATRFWKFERGQRYAEPASASWRAFNRGNWQEALDLLEASRPGLVDYHQRAATADITTHRVRIIEEPLTPYLQWELHLLHLRDQTGGPVRVLPASHILEYEEDCGPLADLNIIAPHALYEVTYDDNGVLESAIRSTDPDDIANQVAFVYKLYRIAEPIRDYFQRAVAHLPPPGPDFPLPEDYLETTGRPRPPGN